MTCFGSTHDADCRAASGPVRTFHPALMPMVDHPARALPALDRWLSDVTPRAALAAFDAEARTIAAEHAALRAMARAARIDAARRFS